MPRNTLPASVLKTPIPVRNGGVILGSLVELALWLGSLPVTTQLAVTLDFPNTLAQTSSPLAVTVNGIRIGDGVLVAPDPSVILANSFYTAEVTGKDEVTVRFHNYSAAPLNPDEALFTLYIFHQ